MFILLRMHFCDLSVHDFRVICLLLHKLISLRFGIEHDLVADSSWDRPHAHLCFINRALALSRRIVENILLFCLFFS